MSFLVNLINDVLADMLEGMMPDQIRLNLLSGNIRLRDVSLKSAFIENILQMPINIVSKFVIKFYLLYKLVL